MTKSLCSLLKSSGLQVPSGLPNPIIENITCDSRSVVKGSLFLGIPGEGVDGGTFWRQAFSSGAVAAVISPSAAKVVPPSSNQAVLVVEEPVNYWIGEIASSFWDQPSSGLSLIGVTGTNGKTTTTHLIEYLCSAVGRQAALFGTIVNRWPTYSEKALHTTPFADILQMQLSRAVASGAEFAAMEVSSHSLVQQRIAGCRFSGAVFTNLTQDHLDYHSSMKSYFEAKALLFSPPLLDCETPKCIISIDDIWGRELANRLKNRCWRSSIVNNATDADEKLELFISGLKLTSSGIEGTLHSPLGGGPFRAPLVGRFNAMNVLQAIGVLLQQGFPLTDLLNAVEAFPGVPGRMERIQLFNVDNESKYPTVIVDYAHTPDGLKNALIAARAFTDQKLICLFGCGGDRDRSKRPQMGAIAAEHADLSIVTSDNPRKEDPNEIIDDILVGITKNTKVIVQANRALAIHVAVKNASSGDVVVIAGKGHEDYQIMADQVIHFDDREYVLEALRNR